MPVNAPRPVVNTNSFAREVTLMSTTPTSPSSTAISVVERVQQAIRTRVQVGPLDRGSKALQALTAGRSTRLNLAESEAAALAALDAVAEHYGFETVADLDAALTAITGDAAEVSSVGSLGLVDVDRVVDRATDAALDVLGEFSRDEQRVESWPSDERDLFRNGHWRSFGERAAALRERIAHKTARAVLESIQSTHA